MPIKGAREFKKFKEGGQLTRKQAILAQCYECNGFEGSKCTSTDCPLYRWSPYTKVSSLVAQNLKNPHPGSKGKPFLKSKSINPESEAQNGKEEGS